MPDLVIYDNVGGGTAKTITVNLNADFLVADNPNPTLTYYVIVSTTSKNVNNGNIDNSYIMSLGQFPLNGTHRSATNSTTPYTTVTELVNDYVYDMVNGHSANQYSSGCSARLGMQF